MMGIMVPRASRTKEDPVTGDWDRAVEAARRLRTDFAPADLLQRSGKTIVIGGSVGPQPVVAKVLLDRGPFWRDKFDREISIYSAFARQAPPVRAPRLIDADPSRGVLILERLAGRPLAADRYPGGPLPADELTAVLDVVELIARWRPEPPTAWGGWDYAERLDRYRGHGLLSDADQRALAALLDQAGPVRCFAHGDVLPGNVRLLDGGRLALLDWEFAGFYLPGFDLALLWVLLRSLPARQLVVGRLAGADHAVRAAFTVNQAMALTRELRIHREADPGPWRDQRLADLMEDWAVFRDDVLHPRRRS
jgi:hypothetical protein